MELRNHHKSSRLSRTDRLYKKLYNKLYYYIALCIFSVSPVLAEGDTNNNSNPVAAATGNVTNQAVQFQNNGAPSRQAFGSNISCNGSTMTFSPFYMGNDTEPQTEDGYVISENWGFQINFMVPLDKSGYKQCKELAKRQEEKMRLEYEITRAHKCADLMKKGFMFRPNAPMSKLCQDIVPIVKAKPKKEKKFKLF